MYKKIYFDRKFASPVNEGCLDRQPSTFYRKLRDGPLFEEISPPMSLSFLIWGTVDKRQYAVPVSKVNT